MVLPVVVGSAGVDGVADGELRGGGGLGSKVLLGLWWFSIKIEQGEGFTGGRESFWWRDWRGGGSGGAEMARAAAAAGVAGDEEGGVSLTIAGYGGSMGVA